MSMLRLKPAVLAVCLLSTAAFPGLSTAGLIPNGDFSMPGTAPDPFESWTTDARYMRPVDGGQVSRFSITNFTDPSVQLEQVFDLPSGATRLTFDYLLSTISSGTDDSLFDDSFQASLVNSLGMAINPIDPLFLEAYFSVDASGTEFGPAGGSVSLQAIAGGWRQVSLTLPSLPEGKYTVEFLILGDDDGRTTTVDVDNVSLSQRVAPIPEPASLLIWSALSIAVIPALRRRMPRRSQQ